jgi:hypothetical protein
MILLEDKLISEDVFENHFVCDLNKCKGACCIEGDSGAPILNNEIDLINENLGNIKSFLTEESKKALGQETFWKTGEDEENEVKCHSNGACIFAIQKDGILSCGIQEAYKQGSSKLIKPISCYLYPIRVSKVGDYTALNYHKWQICDAACGLGKKLNVPLFKFLKEPLIAAFGQQFYELMEEYHQQTYLA